MSFVRSFVLFESVFVVLLLFVRTYYYGLAKLRKCLVKNPFMSIFVLNKKTGGFWDWPVCGLTET